MRIEYLTVPFNTIREQVQVEEADALDYYDTHADEFSTPLPANSPNDDAVQQSDPQPYPQVRSRIIRILADQQAAKLSDQIIKTAQAILLENTRGLAESNGYRVIPDGWSPMALADVAQRIKEQFGVTVAVHRHHDDRWLTRSALIKLPIIGSARLVGQNAAGLVPYVMSAKKMLGQDTDNPLVSLRLQTQIPGMPLISPNGDRCLFRLIGTEVSRVPDSMDQVRPQVVQDAKRLAAYQRLQDDAQIWLDRAQSETVEVLASQLNVDLLTPRTVLEAPIRFCQRHTGAFNQRRGPQPSVCRRCF